MDISKERVRQLEQRALNKLRARAVSTGLQDELLLELAWLNYEQHFWANITLQLQPNVSIWLARPTWCIWTIGPPLEISEGSGIGFKYLR